MHLMVQILSYFILSKIWVIFKLGAIFVTFGYGKTTWIFYKKQTWKKILKYVFKYNK